MSHKIFRSVLVLIIGIGLAVISTPPPALAAGPWYVSPTGNDGNNCLSPATACATINGALDKASSGDTVYVAEGTYIGTGSEVLLINKDIMVSGGWDAGFSAQSGISTIDGQGARRGVTVQSGVTATIQHFTLQNGNVTGNGGGVNNAGTLTIIESSITGNVAGNGSGSAIYNASTGILSLNQSSIRHNGSNGICFVVTNEGTLNADHTIIEENTTTHIYCVATIVINFSGVIHFTNSSISNNLGGGIYNYGALVIENSGVNRNTGSDGPGGIYNWGGNLTVNNSTISSNVNSSGGGIFAGGGGQVRLNNATLVNNSANTGGGVYNYPSSSADVLIQNTILSGNTASGSASNCTGAVGSSGYNLIGDDSGCTFAAATGDLININPVVGVLIGSPSYHPLLSASPAIDAGNPSGCTDQDGDPLSTDQRGVSPIGICDIGAYEYTTPGPVSSLSIMGGDTQSILVNQPFPNPLQVAALDDIGSPVEGVAIDFTAPGSGASGTFADTSTNITSAVSNAGGVAIASSFTANDQAGSYMVSASTAAAAPVSFHLENIGLPPNDNFSNAQVISSLPFLTAADNTNASVEPGEPVGCGMLFRSLWYAFTPSETVPLRVVMPPGQMSGTLSIFRATGPSISDLSFVTCLSTGNSTNLQMNAGETYYLRLDSFGQAGTLQFSLEPLSPPANDNFADAELIGALPFTATVDNTDATVEAGEPFSCSSPFRSLWYSFTPAQDMVIRVMGPTSGVVTILRAEGPSISDLIGVACAYSGTSTNLQVQAGANYYLRVDSFGQPGSLQFSVEQITPPANDNFANAEEIGGLPFSASVDNTNATIESGEPGTCGSLFRSVWYSFTPTESMVLRVDTPAGISFSTVAVFRGSGSSFADLTSLACAFSGSPANFQVEAGQTYYLRLDAYAPPGVLQLNLTQIFPPANDNFADAENISSLPFITTIDTTNATPEPGEPQGCINPPRSVWYSFTPTENMALRANLNGDFGHYLDIFLASGSGISDLNFVTCVSSGISTNLQFEGGQTYYLRFGSYGQASSIQVILEQIFPPANDDFANAESISSLPFSVTADNTDATTQSGEPLGCGSLSRSLWYSFNPAENMTIRVSTAGSFVSSTVSLFRAAGPAITDLNFVGCAGSAPTHFQLEAGQTYYLQLDSFGQGGILQLNLAQLNPPANDNLENAASIGSVPFTASVDITDATTEPNEFHFCYFMPNTVWYSFTPTETMVLRADTLGSPISGNVNIYKSTGSGYFGLQFLNCSGPNSSPSFTAEAGQTYYLQVGSPSGESGIIHVNLIVTNPPLNDNLAGATAVTALPFTSMVEITDATNEPGEPQICIFMPTTVWYAFTPTETIKVQADTQGSTIDANVNVYHATGDGFPNMQNLGCSIFSGGATVFLAEAGEAYYLQVGGSGQAGTVQLNLTELPTISGRLTDAVTGTPLPGNAPPFASVRLERSCGAGCFEFVNSQSADSEGHFLFDSYYYNGAALRAGSYRLEISANQYLTTQFGPFEFNGTSLDVGDVPVSPPSIIRGRAVDANSGNPVAGVSVTLNLCFSEGCFLYVNSQYTDVNGQFYFNSYHYGSPLSGGTYELLFSDSLHQPARIEIEISPGEDRDLGDVALTPFPLIGSISGKLVDKVTGKPVSPTFGPSLALYRCIDGYCEQFVNSLVPDSLGRFRFDADYFGNPIPVGTFQIRAYADQYQEFQGDPFIVGEAENKNIGNIGLISFPIRFSEIQPCAEIPTSGGECLFTVRIWNGMDRNLTGKTWSLASGFLPGTFAGYTDFQIRNPQDLDLGKGKSRVFSFRFDVPSNNTSYGTFLCTRLFVGEGGQALLNTIGFRNLFCVLRNASGFAIVSPQEVISQAQTNATTAETGTEIEPNNSCQSAQDVGAVSDPFVMDGNLDASQGPDIDFFHFTATPGESVAIDHEGQATGKGTLGDPLLGFFDSNCNLIAVNDDSNNLLNSHLDITVPADGVFIMAATAYPDFGFTGGGNGSYRLTVAPVPHISSISGVVTDAVSGNPLSGVAAPFTYVRLLQCGPFGCSDVNSQSAASDGSFHFETDFNGIALRVGEYMIVASADQYQPSQTETFSVGESENYDAGRVALHSYPIRFSNTQICAVPAAGGLCDFSVKITNGLSTRFSGRAWSMIDGQNIGSLINFTSFQSDSLLNVSLDPGRSTVLRFRFQVRGSVADGAYICATAFVGQNPGPLFNTAGVRSLFCFVKGANGFTLMSEQEMHNQLQQMRNDNADRIHTPSGPKK